MKQYNHTTKKYEDPTEAKAQVGSLKKRELCRGNRPHAYRLVIPFIDNYGISDELIDAYYKHKERERAFYEHETVTLLSLGLDAKKVVRYGMFNNSKHFECTACFKRQTTYDKSN